jgi:N-acetylglutamate synthase-like GNAT family acetyltransferase
MIRDLNLSNPDEIQTICVGGKAFADAAGATSFDKTSFIKFVHSLYANKKGKLFVIETDNTVVGGLGVIAYPCFYNNNVLRVQECFWWIDPEHRNFNNSINLFNKIEEWAKEINAHQIMVSSTSTLNPEKLEKFYVKKGFTKVDINYVKDINNA